MVRKMFSLKSMKKLFAGVSLLLCVIGSTGCGSEETTIVNPIVDDELPVGSLPLQHMTVETFPESILNTDTKQYEVLVTKNFTRFNLNVMWDRYCSRPQFGNLDFWNSIDIIVHDGGQDRSLLKERFDLFDIVVKEDSFEVALNLNTGRANDEAFVVSVVYSTSHLDPAIAQGCFPDDRLFDEIRTFYIYFA